MLCCSPFFGQNLLSLHQQSFADWLLSGFSNPISDPDLEEMNWTDPDLEEMNWTDPD